MLDIKLGLYIYPVLMDDLLSALAAAGDPTRLRVLALCARGAFCVNDFCDILGQSQPRLSRHLRLLSEAGLLERSREGANAWFTLGKGTQGTLVRDILKRLPDNDPLLAADRRGATRVLSERARAASEKFRQSGADWDEMRALGLPAEAVEARLLDLLPPGDLGHALDIGTGTGRLLELLAPRIASGLGVDASRTMLALARVRLASQDFAHCAVRLADMYALPLPGESFNLVFLQMVLHYAEDPAAAMEEARRVVAPGGRLIVVDLAQHGRAALLEQMAHRRLGFSDAAMEALMNGAGLAAGQPVSVTEPAAEDGLCVRIWQAHAPNNVLTRSTAEALA
jgi:ubiquinone/menaquinone biosynthesis C-methylase UbiE/DNA-binding transcriptional ArsR family regulator